MDAYTHLRAKPKQKPKAFYADAVDYGNIQVVHVHHYHHGPRKPKTGWEKVYRGLLKGF